MNENIRKILEKMYSMRVREFMDPRAWDMPLLERDEPVSHAFFMLRSNNHAWVVESEKNLKLVGVVERTDLLRAMLPPDALTYAYGSVSMKMKNIFMKKGAKVEDVMTSKLITAENDMLIRDVMIKMKKYGLERLPVIDKKGILIGEVTLKSLIIHFTRMMRESE
jgi:CBS domain-containing protein